VRIHGFTAGGISDVLARAIGARLTASMGQQVVVDVRSGAGTTIASDHVAKSPPDGYTLFLQDTTHAINASPTGGPLATGARLYADRSHRDEPARADRALSLQVKSVKDLVALAKKRPGEIAHGSSATHHRAPGRRDAEIHGRHRMVHVP
jgi:tripartite-type tricarboxylate transporter receptor subunit TctC